MLENILFSRFSEHTKHLWSCCFSTSVLDEDRLKEGPHRYTDTMVVDTYYIDIFSYYIDIFSDDTEKVIQKKLVDLFKKNLLLISENVLEFLKCNCVTISDAEVIRMKKKKNEKLYP